MVFFSHLSRKGVRGKQHRVRRGGRGLKVARVAPRAVLNSAQPPPKKAESGPPGRLHWHQEAGHAAAAGTGSHTEMKCPDSEVCPKERVCASAVLRCGMKAPAESS